MTDARPKDLANSRRLTVGDLVVDRAARLVTRRDDVLDIRGLTFDLFEALIDGGGEPVAAQTLVDRVWRGEAVGDEVITRRVRRLRLALADDPAEPRYVETRSDAGYRICARMIPLSDPPATAPVAQRSAGHWLVVAVLATVFAAGLVARSGVKTPRDTLLERAWTFAATGQNDDNLRAIDLFEGRLEQSPGDYGAQLGLSVALAQRTCRHDAGPSFAHRAGELAGALVAQNADDLEARKALAYADECLGRIDRALDGYLAVWRADSAQLAARASAAHLLQIKGRLADALAHNLALEAATTEWPLRDVDLQLARCLELMGFARAAEARLSRAARLKPENLLAAVAYARFLLTAGRVEEASAVADRAHKLGRSTAALHALRAEIALSLGDRATALQRATTAAAAAPHDTWAQILMDVLGVAPEPAQLAAKVERIRDRAGAGLALTQEQLGSALLLWTLNRRGEALGALDAAFAQGYRDANYLAASPLFAAMMADPLGAETLGRMRIAAARERASALVAPWWPAALIDSDML